MQFFYSPSVPYDQEEGYRSLVISLRINGFNVTDRRICALEIVREGRAALLEVGCPIPLIEDPSPIIAIFEFRQASYAVITATRGAPQSDTFPFFVGPPRDEVNVIEFRAGAV